MTLTFNGSEVEIINKKERKIRYTNTGGYVSSEAKKEAIIERAETIEKRNEIVKISQKEFAKIDHTIERKDGTKKALINGMFKEVKII